MALILRLSDKEEADQCCQDNASCDQRKDTSF
jgi:hypothetical protein